MRVSGLLVTALIGLCLFGAAPARAALLFCNQTKATIEAAFGYRDGATWTSEGWWQIQPGQCARVYNKPLSQRFYFYYARTLGVGGVDSPSSTTWTGKYAFCTDKKAFRIDGDSGCEARGYQKNGFQEIDIGTNKKDYTLTFQETF